MKNKKPTEFDFCRYHRTPFAETHEVFYGRNRQNSMKYGMQVKLCRYCHNQIHSNPNTHKDKKLKEVYQRKFEKQYSHDLFMQIFGRNYL